MTDTPAFVRNGHLDILAANTLGSALYSPAFVGTARQEDDARAARLAGGARTARPTAAALAGPRR